LVVEIFYDLSEGFYMDGLSGRDNIGS